MGSRPVAPAAVESPACGKEGLYKLNSILLLSLCSSSGAAEADCEIEGLGFEEWGATSAAC